LKGGGVVMEGKLPSLVQENSGPNINYHEKVELTKQTLPMVDLTTLDPPP